MTIKELKNMLNDFNDDDRVVINVDGYKWDISEEYDNRPRKRKIKSCWGNDFEAVVIYLDDQVGR